MITTKQRLGHLQFQILQLLNRIDRPFKAYEIFNILNEVTRVSYFSIWMSLQKLCERNLVSLDNLRYRITAEGVVEYHLRK